LPSSTNCYPGAVGELLSQELLSWMVFGHQLGSDLIMRVADDLLGEEPEAVVIGPARPAPSGDRTTHGRHLRTRPSRARDRRHTGLQEERIRAVPSHELDVRGVYLL